MNALKNAKMNAVRKVGIGYAMEGGLPAKFAVITYMMRELSKEFFVCRKNWFAPKNYPQNT